METIEPLQLELASAPPEQSRPPLYLVTNSPPRTPTLPQRKRIRRKSSLIRRIDSSEEIPSSHESIFHAERFPSTNSEDNDSGIWPKATLSLTIGPSTSTNLVGNNENIRDELLAPTIGRTPILYGHGTALTTIVEQKSTRTMSTKVSPIGPGSASEVSLARTSIPNLLGHRGNFDLPSAVTLRSPRRRKSFSADDLVLIKRSYHEACLVIERKIKGSMQIHDVYAEPHTPILPPIERPSTPPGMPSWTAAQNAPTQTLLPSPGWVARDTQNRLQRFLGIRPSLIELSSRIPVPLTLQHSNQSTQVLGGGRSPSSPIPARPAPRFRPTRSGHGTGPLESHPFHHAGRAEAKSDATSVMPRIQTPNLPLSPRPGAPQRVLKTATRGKRQRNVRPSLIPLVTGAPQISNRGTYGSRVTESLHEEVSSQCPHRRGRQASLRSLNQHAEVVVPDTDHAMANYTLLASNDPQGNPTQQPIQSTPVTEPQIGINAQITGFQATRPVMAGAIAPSSPTVAPPAKSAPHTQRCWKCNVSKIVSKLDEIWEASTSWCCWVFCGVDLYDDGESQCCGHGNGAQPGDGQGSLGPRRVVLDGTPVILY
jgi:hypothetical protein